MKFPYRTFPAVQVLVTVASLIMGVSQSRAQSDYPNRPIRLITPAAAGGTTDILARLFGAKLSEGFKQQVIVDNRASASGIVGAEIAARSAPDGYTLFLAYHQHTVNAALNSKLPYHPVNDFTPITQLTAAGLMLVINPSTPARNLKEFVEWTRTYKGALNFGSAGLGSGGHLSGELYNLMAGIKAQHIPYSGTGPSMIALLGGQYQYSFAGMAGAVIQMRSGKLRAIAVTNPSRVAALPEVPAMSEVLPGFDVVGWYGLVAPARLPQPLLTRLHTEIVKILNQADVRDRILADGAEPVSKTPEEFRKYMLADLAKWAKLVKDSGAKFE